MYYERELVSIRNSNIRERQTSLHIPLGYVGREMAEYQEYKFKQRYRCGFYYTEWVKIGG